MSTAIYNIRRIISERGLKQRAIAQRIGIDEQKFSSMLCGRKIITADDILPIAAALGVTPNDLFITEEAQAT